MESLENLYRIGREALVSGNIDKQRKVLTYISSNISFTTKKNALGYAKSIYPSGECMDVKQLASECVPNNLQAYCQALWDEMHIGQPSVNFIAVERLQHNMKHFETGTILHQSNNGVLTVSDLLKLISRVSSCIQLITGIDTSRLRQATTALHGLELLLSNKHDKLDGIGCVVEVFGAVSEQMTANQAIKQNILGTETVLSLALEFFTRPKITQQ